MEINSSINYLADPNFNNWLVWLFIIGSLAINTLIQSLKYFQKLCWLILAIALIVSGTIAYFGFQNIPLLFIGLTLSIMGSCLGHWIQELRK